MFHDDVFDIETFFCLYFFIHSTMVLSVDFFSTSMGFCDRWCLLPKCFYFIFGLPSSSLEVTSTLESRVTIIIKIFGQFMSSAILLYVIFGLYYLWSKYMLIIQKVFRSLEKKSPFNVNDLIQILVSAYKVG